MKISTERILTTHTGSLPRPADLEQMMSDREQGSPVDEADLHARVANAVADAVAAQVLSGVDVINDGEAGKISYFTYVKDRLTGFDGEAMPGYHREFAEFPSTMKWFIESTAVQQLKMPSCTGPISRRDAEAVYREIDHLRAGVKGHSPTDVFLTAASPGVIASFLGNQHYDTDEEYIFAIAEAMKPEYDAIAESGFLLQLDCPDLAMTRAIGDNADRSDDEFRDQVRLHVRALNHAVRDIPPEKMRLHLCWGNEPFPHVYDIPLHKIIDIVLDARPAAMAFEAANPRHEHEWKVWEDVKLPPGKVLIPGVLDSCTNYVEHPELVAQRLVCFAELVGRENVIAGSDCGFGTFSGLHIVDPPVTWLKLHAMAEGARLASQYLW